MEGTRGHRSVAIAVAGAALGMLWLAPPASSFCSKVISDPGPGYNGPAQRGIACSHDEDGAEELWTVPLAISEARFIVSGSDDPTAVRGGYVMATLDVSPGETLSLSLGSQGGASFLKRGETLLIAGGGGNGLEPNYVSPGAREVKVQPPGRPNGPYPANGEIWVSWYEGWISKPPLVRCEVPKLRGLKPPAARRALAAADCTARAFGRKPARRAMWGRIVSQQPPPGTVLSAGSEIAATVGSRPQRPRR